MQTPTAIRSSPALLPEMGVAGLAAEQLPMAADFPAEPGSRPVDQRAERAATQLGVEASTIERLPFDLSVLNEGGIFANVDASGFGVLDRRLDWRALGIEASTPG